MSELQVESVSIDSLMEDPDNTRKHNERNIEAISTSLATFGQRRPLVVWQDTVIAGNGTLRAAKNLGWTKIVVSRVPDSWSEHDARAYAIADNRTAELAEWDNSKLLEQLMQLPDIQATGFTSTDLDDLDAAFGLPPTLDSLKTDFDAPISDSDLIELRLSIPNDVHDKWLAAKKATGQVGLEADILVIQAAFDALVNDEI